MRGHNSYSLGSCLRSATPSFLPSLYSFLSFVSYPAFLLLPPFYRQGDGGRKPSLFLLVTSPNNHRNFIDEGPGGLLTCNTEYSLSFSLFLFQESALQVVGLSRVTRITVNPAVLRVILRKHCREGDLSNAQNPGLTV